MLDVLRRELKYIISATDVVNLKRQLERVMREDVHNHSNGYMVRSVYFDSPYDSDFEDKVGGYDNRQKIRLRIYDVNSPRAKLEIKEKSGVSQRKRSLSLTREEAESMLRADYGFLCEREEAIAHWLYTFLTIRCYRPKCIVEYDRMAFCEPVNDIRVTFDSGLRATELNTQDLFDKNLMLYPVCSSSEITMEVKYNGFLYTHIKNIISQVDKMQVSNSKYIRSRMITKKGRV